MSILTTNCALVVFSLLLVFSKFFNFSNVFFFCFRYLTLLLAKNPTFLPKKLCSNGLAALLPNIREYESTISHHLGKMVLHLTLSYTGTGAFSIVNTWLWFCTLLGLKKNDLLLWFSNVLKKLLNMECSWFQS